MWLNQSALLIVAVWSVLIGIWICERCVQALGAHDHPSIVWDEIAAFWLVISWVDAKVKGGFGVMVDDVLAAAATLLVIFGVKALAGI